MLLLLQNFLSTRNCKHLPAPSCIHVFFRFPYLWYLQLPLRLRVRIEAPKKDRMGVHPALAFPDVITLAFRFELVPGSFTQAASARAG